MSIDPRRTSPIMRWWCECSEVLCDLYRQCPHCGRWPAPAPAPEGGDWWDPDNEGLCVWAAYQPKGAANLAASYIDLSGNGNNTVPGVAPTWDIVNGWKFNGVNQYLVTTFVPQNDQSQSAVVQFTNVAVGNGALFGSDDGVGLRFFILPNLAGTDVRYTNGGVRTIAPPLLAGNLGIAGDFGYRNGIVDTLAIAAWGGAAVSAVYIGCKNLGGVPASLLDCNIQALALYDCVLTAPQVATVAAAMAAL